MNLSIFSVKIQEATCDCIFNFFDKFENYLEILNNPNLLTILLNLFLVLERILVVNGKQNKLLSAYLYINRSIFERVISFGNNKNKLAVLLFNNLVNKKEEEDENEKSEKIFKDENEKINKDKKEKKKEKIEKKKNTKNKKKIEQEIQKTLRKSEVKKILIELNSENYQKLDYLFNLIKNIKEYFELKNLSNYLVSMERFVLDFKDHKSEKYFTRPIKLQKILDSFQYVNVLENQQNFTKINTLNVKDANYINKFDSFIYENCLKTLNNEELMIFMLKN